MNAKSISAVSTVKPPVEDAPVRDEKGEVADHPANKKPKPLGHHLSYTDIAICIGQTDAKGQRQETVHQIDGSDVRITNVQHGIKEKMRAQREDGQFIGWEPSGEYELVLKVTFFKE